MTRSHRAKWSARWPRGQVEYCGLEHRGSRYAASAVGPTTFLMSSEPHHSKFGLEFYPATIMNAIAHDINKRPYVSGIPERVDLDEVGMLGGDDS